MRYNAQGQVVASEMVLGWQLAYFLLNICVKKIQEKRIDSALHSTWSFTYSSSHHSIFLPCCDDLYNARK